MTILNIISERKKTKWVLNDYKRLKKKYKQLWYPFILPSPKAETVSAPRWNDIQCIIQNGNRL